jgi:phospholipid/cholesterol/gamma-HCH transport system permease protein
MAPGSKPRRATPAHLARIMAVSLLSLPVRFLASLGHVAATVARHAGLLALLFAGIVGALFRGRVSARARREQAFDMGVESMPLVLIIAILSGVVTSQQGGYQFTGQVPLYVVGSVVSSSIILELGPVLTAFVMIGRVGARITAELGTMKVSEQIDALNSLGRDPVSVLAAPRLLAGMFVVPFLVAMADLVGLYAGMVAAQMTLGLGSEGFFYGARMYWHNWDLFYSLLKGFSFGFIMPLIAVHMGFLTTGGAEGVGRSTNASVVFMTTTMLVMDALFPPLLLG